MPANNSAVVETGVHSFALRRVNPFLGVLQVIKTNDGRAVSTNGIVWDIEVRAERNDGWGSLNRNNRQLAYYRYGLWSLEDGLVSRPLAPQLDNTPLSEQCNRIIQCITDRLELLPFNLIDSRELWLFDQNDEQPLVLLASMTKDSQPPSPEPKYWTSSIGANGAPSQYRFPQAQELETMVKQVAGFNIKTQWIDRRDDGSGISGNKTKLISGDMFPSFLITEKWPQTNQEKLVADYIEWISPSLLTLQHLDREERKRIEKNLNIQAISIEHHWHLYPEIIDEQCLTAARVQCRMQKAGNNRSE